MRWHQTSSLRLVVRQFPGRTRDQATTLSETIPESIEHGVRIELRIFRPDCGPLGNPSGQCMKINVLEKK